MIKRRRSLDLRKNKQQNFFKSRRNKSAFRRTVTFGAVAVLIAVGAVAQFINTNAKGNQQANTLKEYVLGHLDSKYVSGQTAKQVGSFINNPTFIDFDALAAASLDIAKVNFSNLPAGATLKDFKGQGVLFDVDSSSNYYVGYAGESSFMGKNTKIQDAKFFKSDKEINEHFDEKTGLVYINKKDVSLKDNDLTVKTLRVLGENKSGKINVAVNSFNSEINSINNRTEKLSVLAGNFSVQIADTKANTNVNKIHVYLNGSEKEMDRNSFNYSKGRVYINAPVATVQTVQIVVDDNSLGDKVADAISPDEGEINETADEMQSYIVKNADANYAKGDNATEIGGLIIRTTYMDAAEISKRGIDPATAKIDQVFEDYEQKNPNDPVTAVVMTYTNLVSLYDVNPESEYYVAYVDTSSPLGKKTKIQDAVFAKANINGEVIDGHFDQNTGLAYIKKTDMTKDGVFENASAQIQTLQVIDFTNNPEQKTKVAINIDSDDSSIKDDEKEVSVKALATEATIPLDLEKNVDKNKVHVYINGEENEIPKTGFEFENGELKIAQSAAVISNVDVKIDKEGIAETISNILSEPVYAADNLSFDQMKKWPEVGDLGLIEDTDGNSIKAGAGFLFSTLGAYFDEGDSPRCNSWSEAVDAAVDYTGYTASYSYGYMADDWYVNSETQMEKAQRNYDAAVANDVEAEINTSPKFDGHMDNIKMAQVTRFVITINKKYSNAHISEDDVDQDAQPGTEHFLQGLIRRYNNNLNLDTVDDWFKTFKNPAGANRDYQKVLMACTHITDKFGDQKKVHIDMDDDKDTTIYGCDVEKAGYYFFARVLYVDENDGYAIVSFVGTSNHNQTPMGTIKVPYTPRYEVKVRKLDADRNKNTNFFPTDKNYTGESPKEQGDAKFQGARFQIYNDNNGSKGEPLKYEDADGHAHNVVLTIKSEPDDDGYYYSNVSAKVLEVGKYYWLEEKEAPEGYNDMVPNPKRFRITNDQVNSNPSILEITSKHRILTLNAKDNIKRNDVEIQKCDIERLITTGDCGTNGAPQGDTKLAGIKFNIINVSDESVLVDPDGNDEDTDSSHTHRTKECKSFKSIKDDDNALKALTGNDVCLTLTTDANGKASTSGKALPYGTYKIFEIPDESLTDSQGNKYANPYYLYTDTAVRTFEIRSDKTEDKISFTESTNTNYINEPAKITGDEDFTALGDDNKGRLFYDYPVRGDVKVYKCDNEARPGASKDNSRTCMPIGGADFANETSGNIAIAIWNRSERAVAVRNQQNNIQASRPTSKTETTPVDGDFKCDPVADGNYDVSKACLILTFRQDKIDDIGYFVETLQKAFPVGHYEFREVDRKNRTNPQNYSNESGYFLTDTTKTHKFTIDPVSATPPSGWKWGKYLPDPATHSDQIVNANQDGQIKIFKNTHNYHNSDTYNTGADDNDAPLFNQVRRGDLHFQKKIEDCADPSLNGSAFAFVPFLLVSKTNGEAHILVTDENGYADTAFDWLDNDIASQKFYYHPNANDTLAGKTDELGRWNNQGISSVLAKQDECLEAARGVIGKTDAAERKAAIKAVQETCNVNESSLDQAHAEYRTWFGSDIRGNLAPVDNTKVGALPYDDYELIELHTQRHTDLKLQLVSSIVKIRKDKSSIEGVTVKKADLDLGTLDDIPECDEDCEIELTKSSVPKSGSTVERGSEITYNITLKNVGKHDNENYGVRDYIPEGTTYVEGSATIGNSETGTVKFNDGNNALKSPSVDWTGLKIKAGKTVTISFKVTVNQDAPQVIYNEALGQNDWPGNTNDPTDPSNEVHHFVPIEQGCVKIKKWSDPAPGSTLPNDSGDEITYTLTMTNTCATTRPYVQVRDYIPAGTTYKDGSVSSTEDAIGAYVSPNAESSAEEAEEEPSARAMITDDSANPSDQSVGEEKEEAKTINRNGYVEWLLPKLKPAETRTVTFTVVTNEEHLGWVENTAYLDDFGGKGENPGNPGEMENDPKTSPTGVPSNTVIHRFPDGPEIPPYPFLEKSSIPAPGATVNPGDEILYELTYYNLGSQDITTAGIRDIIPEGTTYVDGSATLQGYYNKNLNSVDWKGLYIAAGESIKVTFKVKVNGGTNATMFENSHAAVSDCEGNTADGSGAANGPRIITNQALYQFNWNGGEDPINKSNIVEHKKRAVHGYCLTVRKESEPKSGTQVHVGDTIKYTLPATNTGAKTVPFTRIRDYIPEGTTYKEGSVSEGGVYVSAEDSPTGEAYVEWVLRDIKSNETNRSAFYSVTVNESHPEYIENTALYESTEEDPGKPGDPELPEPGKETNKVIHWFTTPPPCMLNGIKESDPIPGTIVKTDDIITYKLTLINDGGLDCTHAMIRDVIPTHTAYVEGSATDGGTYNANTNAVEWKNLVVPAPGPDGAINNKISVTFKVKVTEGEGNHSIFNQFDFGENNLDNTSNIVEHPVELAPAAPKTGILTTKQDKAKASSILVAMIVIMALSAAAYKLNARKNRRN